MRNAQITILNDSDGQTVYGPAIDVGQIFSATFQPIFGDVYAAGTVKLQASNEFAYNRAIFQPQYWADVPNATSSASSGSAPIISIPQLSYSFLRAVYTPSGNFTQRLIVRDAVVASKYFLINSANNADLYYAWFNPGGTGVDPMIPGRIGYEVYTAGGAKPGDIQNQLGIVVSGIAGGTKFSMDNTGLCVNISAGLGYPASVSPGATNLEVVVVSGGTSTVRVLMNSSGV